MFSLHNNCRQTLASYIGSSSSALHQKVKYLSEGQIKEILGDQSMERQCLVAAIQHKPEVESSAHEEKDL